MLDLLRFILPACEDHDPFSDVHASVCPRHRIIRIIHDQAVRIERSTFKMQFAAFRSAAGNSCIGFHGHCAAVDIDHALAGIFSTELERTARDGTVIDGEHSQFLSADPD